MENKNLPALIASSANPKQVGATVTAVIIGLASTIVLVANNFGINITTEAIQEFAAQLGIAISAVWFVFGVIRKVVVAIARWWKAKNI